MVYSLDSIVIVIGSLVLWFVLGLVLGLDLKVWIYGFNNVYRDGECDWYIFFR